MEFKHINQPDFDRKRDGAIREILKVVWTKAYKNLGVSQTTFMQRAYNEGYKQALRDWGGMFYEGVRSKGYVRTEEIISEVDKIDKEG